MNMAEEKTSCQMKNALYLEYWPNIYAHTQATDAHVYNI